MLSWDVISWETDTVCSSNKTKFALFKFSVSVSYCHQSCYLSEHSFLVYRDELSRIKKKLKVDKDTDILPSLSKDPKEDKNEEESHSDMRRKV